MAFNEAHLGHLSDRPLRRRKHPAYTDYPSVFRVPQSVAASLKTVPWLERVTREEPPRRKNRDYIAHPSVFGGAQGVGFPQLKFPKAWMGTQGSNPVEPPRSSSAKAREAITRGILPSSGGGMTFVAGPIWEGESDLFIAPDKALRSSAGAWRDAMQTSIQSVFDGWGSSFAAEGYGQGTLTQSGASVTIAGGTFTSSMVGGQILTTASYSTGTAAASGGTIGGITTVWDSDMVGGVIEFSSGVSAEITGFTSGVLMSIDDPNLTIAPAEAYVISFTRERWITAFSTGSLVSVGPSSPDFTSESFQMRFPHTATAVGKKGGIYSALRGPEGWSGGHQPVVRMGKNYRDRRPDYERAYPSFFALPRLVPTVEFTPRDWTDAGEQTTTWTEAL